MIKNIFIGLSIATVVAMGWYLLSYSPTEVTSESVSAFAIEPVEHASFGLTFAGLNILNDPVGDARKYIGIGVPDVILLSDIHSDHFDVDTLAEVMAASTTIIAPEAVFAELPAFLKDQTIAMANGDSHTVGGLIIDAVPMYNLPMEGEDYRHVKGRGNGYILESNNTRMYIAGDTEDIPEMRALSNIDVAFIPMNLPYTMDVETAAQGVLAFAPGVVYPYHYRGAAGLADITEFERLVNESNSEIEVRLLNWYSE